MAEVTQAQFDISISIRPGLLTLLHQHTESPLLGSLPFRDFGFHVLPAKIRVQGQVDIPDILDRDFHRPPRDNSVVKRIAWQAKAFAQVH